MPSHGTPTQSQSLNPDGQTLHVIHRLDDSNNGGSAEIQRLQREVIEKHNRIKELEAREEHFTQEIDRLQCNMDDLKEQFEAYCVVADAARLTKSARPSGRFIRAKYCSGCCFFIIIPALIFLLKL